MSADSIALPGINEGSRPLVDTLHEWVTTVDLNEVDIISPRLRNYEFSPVNGFLADQAVVN